jgi:VanZ family protein
LIFGVQAFGAALLTWLVGADLRETFLPILLLVVVAAVAFVFRSRRSSAESRRALAPVFIYMLYIFTLSQMSFAGVSTSLLSKLIHVTEYATLALFLSGAWKPLLDKKGVFPFVCVVLACGTLYGLTDEFHQSFTPLRHPSLQDSLIDGFGSGVGIAVFLSALRVRNRFQRETLSSRPPV